MRVGCLLSVLLLLGVGLGVGVVVSKMEPEDPFTGDYEQPSLRSLILTKSQHVTRMIAPLKQWADAHGYKFRISSPTGQPESILLEIWNGTIVIVANDRTAIGGSDKTGLDMSVYWNGDVANDAALDDVAQQMKAVLSPFGSVETSSAPPGTAPREESTNLWRRH